ncbi:DUF2231 domain-containing protein [Cytophagaceae bacterium ABcell3]|nr:DUF2231 domain-containing protein [Cytophagaceae bacterium ABcell3]
MRSKANFKTHPIHPMLVVFPLGLLFTAFIFDLLAVLSGNSTFWQTGSHLNIAGIIGGLLAAVPGIIDYYYTIPPDSSAKTRGTNHARVNTSAILIFVLVYILRGELGGITPFIILGLEVVALGLLTVGGWMGGTLVYRNQIGVDHRFAGAGKWKEESVDPEAKEKPLAKEDELEMNQMKLLHLNGKRIVLAKTQAGYVAYDDRCSHKGGSLAGGSVVCNTVQCPWHGSQFDVHTGEVKEGPAKEKIKTYKVTIKNGRVMLGQPIDLGHK